MIFAHNDGLHIKTGKKHGDYTGKRCTVRNEKLGVKTIALHCMFPMDLFIRLIELKWDNSRHTKFIRKELLTVTTRTAQNGMG